MAQVLTDDLTEAAAAAAVARHPLDEAAGCRVVVRNGVVDKGLSDLSSLPDGVFVGGLADAPADFSARLVSLSDGTHLQPQCMPVLLRKHCKRKYAATKVRSTVGA